MNIEEHIKIPDLPDKHFYQVIKTSEELGPGPPPMTKITNYQTKEGLIFYLNKDLNNICYDDPQLSFSNNGFDYYGDGDWWYEIKFYVTLFDD